MAVDLLRSLLEQAFPGSDVKVQDRTGGGDHFLVTVASARFDGLPLLEQHRLVNQGASRADRERDSV